MTSQGDPYMTEREKVCAIIADLDMCLKFGYATGRIEPAVEGAREYLQQYADMLSVFSSIHKLGLDTPQERDAHE